MARPGAFTVICGAIGRRFVAIALAALMTGATPTVFAQEGLRADQENFDYATSLKRGAIVHFVADFCGPCRVNLPAIRKAAARLDLQFLIMDMETASDLVAKLGIRSVPTTLLFHDGDILDVVNGAISEEALHTRFGDKLKHE